MMRSRSLSGLAAAGLSTMLMAAGAPHAPSPKDKPSVTAAPLPRRAEPNVISIVRSLAALQDRIANGSREALAEQAVVATALSRQLAGLKPRWDDARSRTALVKFVLSGGDPRPLVAALSANAFPAAELPLARGVIAYAWGDRKSARQELSGVAPRGLPPTLGGHVALVKALLGAADDPVQALAFCDDARLLSPGTLVEEAALRLAIELAIEVGDARRFETSVVRHLNRFSASPYASSIDTRVALVIASQDERKHAWRWLKLPELIETLPGARRQVFVIRVAEAALRAGNVEVAARTARLLRTSSPPGGRLQAWSAAIEGAALILEKDRGPALERLMEAELATTDTEVRRLIAEARALADVISAPSAVAPAPAPPTEGGDTQPRFAKLAERAEARLADADRLLTEGQL